MLKGTLKALRASQPFNAVATSGVRWITSRLNLRREWAARHLHRMGEVASILPNGQALRFWSRGDDWVSNQIYWKGWAGYEPESSRVFFHLAEHARTVIDIGAYVGYYTLLAGHANPNARVLALEPLKGPHERLCRHVDLNGLSNVTCLSLAAGAKDGQAVFFATPDELPTSSSLSHSFMRAHPELREVPVEVICLDRLAAERGVHNIDLVKLDIETTEPEALKGMRGILQRDRPAILCEVLSGHGVEPRLEEILAPWGYRYYLLTADGPQLRARIEAHATWLNYLFISDAGALRLDNLKKNPK